MIDIINKIKRDRIVTGNEFVDALHEFTDIDAEIFLIVNGKCATELTDEENETIKALNDRKADLITKYSAPFSPSDLEAWGWEKDEKPFDLQKGEWKIALREKELTLFNLHKVKTQTIKLEITQIEMQMLLQLITGGEG